MRFDLVIGNPPYQKKYGRSARAIYDEFVNFGINNGEKVVMIIPARWYSLTAVNELRSYMFNSEHVKILVDFPSGLEVFENTRIAGGICYFLYDNNYSGDCTIVNKDSTMKRKINEFSNTINGIVIGAFIRDNIAVRIIRKIQGLEENGFINHVYPGSIYVDTKNTKTMVDGKIPVLISMIHGKGIRYLDEKAFNSIVGLDKYKIITANVIFDKQFKLDGNNRVIGRLTILKPYEACSDLYTILGFANSYEEAKNFCSYVNTKLFRMLLLQRIGNIHITRPKFEYIPDQNYTAGEITDEQLYERYNLSDEEINYIETNIKNLENT